MNFKVGDKVVVTTGKDKGKEGKILTILREADRVVVEGVNLVKKHIKPTGQTPGSIVDRESTVHASNVMHIDPKSKKATRVGHTVDKKGKRVRIAKNLMKK